MNVVSLVVMLIGLVLTAYGISFPWREHRATRRAGDVDAGQRRHRAGRRTPLTLLAAPADPPAVGSLVVSIQENRRAPLQYVKPRFKPRAAWFWFRRIYTVRETEPKAAFPVDSWKYNMGVEGMFRHGSGFVFEFRLAAGENGHHLLRSALSQKKTKERLVVVASVDEAANPDAQVRCLVVDAETLRLSPTDQRFAMVQSADKLKGGEPRVFTERQCEVPEDALFLTHPAQQGCAPLEEWGRRTEEFIFAASPLKLGGGDGDEDLREARRHARRRRRNTIAKHAAFWVYWFGASVYMARTSEDGSQLFWKMFAFALVLLLVAVLGVVFVSVLREALNTARWFRGPNGPKIAWTGGTVTAAELGTMIGGLGKIPPKIWNRYVATAPRTATGEPALLRDLGDKHLGSARDLLQNVIALPAHGQNISRDLLDLLVEADMCIPGPGLHTSGLTGDEVLASASFEGYREILELLWHRQCLLEVYKSPVERLHVVHAARFHLQACVDYLSGSPSSQSRRSLTASLRSRAVIRCLNPDLLSDIQAFASQIDTVEYDDCNVGIAEALYVYFLARRFGITALEAAGGADGLVDALEQAAGCPSASAESPSTV